MKILKPTLRNNSLFYEVVQVSLGLRDYLSRCPEGEDWREIFYDAQKQAVVGVIFEVLEKLNTEGMKPPVDLLYEWIGQAEQIRQRNNQLNKRCREITQIFIKAGYECCILKGQGNARMYKNPQNRTPGDIDLWVYGRKDNDDISKEQLRKDVTSFVRERIPDAFEQSHHIDFPIFEDVMVEVHYVPNILSNPKYDRRFREWCIAQEKKELLFCENAGYYVPSVYFNAVYQMVHLFTHFFTEGIGLRHFIDYFYVLKSLEVKKIEEIRNTLVGLGLDKFARGVMWIEKECLALEESYLLFEPDIKIGEFIKKEMEEGGNFGQYDTRFTLRNNGVLARGVADTGRLITLARMFPSESFWKVMEKIANQRWKLKK